MRVCPIGCVQRTMTSSRVQNRIHEVAPQPPENTENAPSFKGIRWGGAIGSVIGTFAGIGLGAVATIATGGLAVPFFAGVIDCTAGGIGGDMLDAKYNKNYPKDGEDTYHPDINDIVP